MKNGSPKAYCRRIDARIRQGTALSGREGPGVSRADGLSRENWKRASFSMPAEIVVLSCRLIALEKSRSMALALAPHCCTSKRAVRLPRAARKIIARSEQVLRAGIQSILPRVAMALFSRVIGAFSLGSLNLVAKKVHQCGVDAVGVVLLGLR